MAQVLAQAVVAVPLPLAQEVARVLQLEKAQPPSIPLVAVAVVAQEVVALAVLLLMQVPAAVAEALAAQQPLIVQAAVAEALAPLKVQAALAVTALPALAVTVEALAVTAVARAVMPALKVEMITSTSMSKVTQLLLVSKAQPILVVQPASYLLQSESKV